MLTIVTFRWGKKYGPEYVRRLEAGVRRHLTRPHRFRVIADREGACGLSQLVWRIPVEDEPLLAVPGCFARLRLFDRDWQTSTGIWPDGRVVCMDLDTVITGPLDPLFERPEPFVVFAGANASNPCPFNGSLWMLRAGYRPDVWADFSLAAARETPIYAFPDDQGWFAARMPDAATWRAGPSSGVYAFRKPGWPGGNDLPAGARMVVFPGFRDPSHFADLPWVKAHWR